MAYFLFTEPLFGDDSPSTCIAKVKEARRKGVRLGRPPGSTIPPKDFVRKHADVVRRLREGHSVRNTAKLCEKGMSTVQRVKRANGAK